jgi:hypothetical protein
MIVVDHLRIVCLEREVVDFEARTCISGVGNRARGFNNPMPLSYQKEIVCYEFLRWVRLNRTI